jgi:hypothetical protein
MVALGPWEWPGLTFWDADLPKEQMTDPAYSDSGDGSPFLRGMFSWGVEKPRRRTVWR